MQFSVTFRHMDSTSALKSYAHERLLRIKKYFPDPIACHVVMSTERYQHRVDVNLQLHNGFQVAGHETTENMYSSIDLVAAKIERQVRRYKDKLRAHKVRDMQPVPFVHSIFADPPEQAEDDAQQRPPLPVTREQIRAEPMSVEEAVMQLNLLHQSFLVFRNDESGNVSVVYRRDGGEYGLIETGGSG